MDSPNSLITLFVVTRSTSAAEILFSSAILFMTAGTGNSGQDAVLTEDAALELALTKAGVSFAQLTKCEVKYNAKKDGKEYKIHFHVDKDHYEYVVDAVTGEITEKATPGPATPEKPVPPHEKEETGKVTPAGPKK